VRYLGSELVEGGIESTAKPPVGDYPVPAKGRDAG
jgi:hypothetical protein